MVLLLASHAQRMNGEIQNSNSNLRGKMYTHYRNNTKLVGDNVRNGQFQLSPITLLTSLHDNCNYPNKELEVDTGKLGKPNDTTKR